MPGADFVIAHFCRNEGVAELTNILKSLDLCKASEQMQRQSYLGNHADLLAYMKDKGKTTMTTAAVRTWLEKNGRFPSAYARQGITLGDCDIDHVLPRSVGGVNHPYNYYILPKRLNRRWSGWWTAHKMTYMGAANVKVAKNFFLWVREEGERLRIDYNAYDQQRLLS